MKSIKTLINILFLHSSIAAQEWVQIDNFPGTERDDAVFFQSGSDFYVGTGLAIGWVTTYDFYRFDPESESWNQLNTDNLIPPRQYASSFSIGGKGFVLGGSNGNIKLNDVWKLDATLNHWQQVASIPILQGLEGAVSFSYENEAILVGGRTSNTTNNAEVFSYKADVNLWSVKSIFPFEAPFKASSVSMGSNAYIAGGRLQSGVYSNKVYAYSFLNEQWTIHSTLPFAGRAYGSLITLDTMLCWFGGLDSLGQSYNDLWYFDGSWKQSISMPASGRRGGVFFSYAGKLFYSTGINENNVRLNETWVLRNLLSMPKYMFNQRATLYPNPSSSSSLTIEGENIKQIMVFDCYGKCIIRTDNPNLNTELEIEGKGIYLAKIFFDNEVISQKIIFN